MNKVKLNEITDVELGRIEGDVYIPRRERERWYKRRREREGSKERKWRRNVGERVNSRDELNACELTRATESSPGMVVTV